MTTVLLVGKGPPERGGIAAYLHGLQSSWLGERHELRFLNLTRDEVPRTGRLTASNVSRTLSDALRVWRTAGAAEIVHIHTALVPAVTFIRAGLLGLAGRLRGCRVIVHVHSGMVQFWVTSPLRRLLARLCLLTAHTVVAVSQGSREALQGSAGRRRVVLIDNGVELSSFGSPEPPHEPPRVLYAGLLTPRKGVIDLLEASTLLARRGVAHELLLAGGTPDEGPEAEEEVLRKVSGSPARLLGALPHEAMPAVYRTADVFCLPSWWEAMPLSVLEAMASELAIVATDVGDVSRAVEEGVSGRLVPAKDPRALAFALEDLLRDPQRRLEMGRRGRLEVERSFDVAGTLAAVDKLYRELSDPQPATGRSHPVG